ncbi:MAG TPA: TonB-dependent receptor [Saprospiraceae bacterium]|nr:TonB-dependent receptor [Saprospiraceae bacterium]HMQ82663.1 TonB-dependent receptor [Saprospiraceae bacterium]
MLRLLVCLMGLAMTQGLYAQGTVTGSVKDKNGEPLIGATILLSGTSKGTATDFDGNYALDGIDVGSHQVIASYTGYQDQIETVVVENGKTTTLNFSLGEDVEILEEVVVIGYGTVKKSDATGVVTSVTDEKFNKGAIVSPDLLLSGKVAGVQITPNSGEPGGKSKIRIRGGTSINASNEPLYVIDGVPIENVAHDPGGFSGGRNPLNFLNPSDIETFTVLKDASATAIYGSRAANGVILITTKKGVAGSRPTLTYDGYYTTSSIVGEPAILDAEAFRNVVTFKAPDRLEELGNTSTNWFDEMLQTATGQNHNLTFTGGGQNIGYRLSAGYQQLDGIVRSSSTERTNFSMNINNNLLDDKLIINTNFKGSFTKDQFDPGQVGAAWSFDPTQSILDPDNTAFGGYFEYGNPNAPRNPVAAIEQVLDEGRYFRGIGNMQLEYKLDGLIEGLSAKANIGFDITNGQRSRFLPTTYLNEQVSNRNGEIRIENLIQNSNLLETWLNYKKDIGEAHRVDITAGYSYQNDRREYPSLVAFDLETDVFGVNSTRPATEFEASNTVVPGRLISFFGRLNYSFDDRYLITATFRRDGSTRFGPSNRWGNFPSVALAWRILEEGFASGLNNVFSDLKLRLGYGVNGNQSIGEFLYLPLYQFSDFRARYQFGYGADGEPIYITTARPNAYDAALKWEETTSYNIGLDFGFSNGRINGSLEYYLKRTDDLLFTVNVPAGTNLSDRVLTNIGEIENSGIELQLAATLVDTRNFNWDINFNAALNDNEVIAIDRISEQGILTGGISGGVGNNVQIHQVGSPVSSFFLFKHILDENGLPRRDDIDYNENGTTAINGDLSDIYEDVNGDGSVDDLDKRVVEQPAPKYLFGLTTSFRISNFDVSATLRSNLGHYIYNNNASLRGYFDRIDESGVSLNNLHTSVLETNFTRPQYFSDYYLEDASFLRLDNISIGYTIRPANTFTSIRLYATGQNLLTLTNYTGLDPEVDNGIDNNPYPRARGFIFGVSIGL